MCSVRGQIKVGPPGSISVAVMSSLMFYYRLFMCCSNHQNRNQPPPRTLHLKNFGSLLSATEDLSTEIVKIQGHVIVQIVEVCYRQLMWIITLHRHQINLPRPGVAVNLAIIIKQNQLGNISRLLVSQCTLYTQFRRHLNILDYQVIFDDIEAGFSH